MVSCANGTQDAWCILADTFALGLGCPASSTPIFLFLATPMLTPVFPMLAKAVIELNTRAGTLRDGSIVRATQATLGVASGISLKSVNSLLPVLFWAGALDRDDLGRLLIKSVDALRRMANPDAAREIWAEWKNSNEYAATAGAKKNRTAQNAGEAASTASTATILESMDQIMAENRRISEQIAALPGLIREIMGGERPASPLHIAAKIAQRGARGAGPEAATSRAVSEADELPNHILIARKSRELLISIEQKIGSRQVIAELGVPRTTWLKWGSGGLPGKKWQEKINDLHDKLNRQATEMVRQKP